MKSPAGDQLTSVCSPGSVVIRVRRRLIACDRVAADRLPTTFAIDSPPNTAASPSASSAPAARSVCRLILSTNGLADRLGWSAAGGKAGTAAVRAALGVFGTGSASTAARNR